MFFEVKKSSFSDKQIKTASKNTECFVENALAMLNIRVMTHPRPPFMVRQAHQPGGSGRRTESGFAEATSDWSRLTKLAVPVARPAEARSNIATIKKGADLLSQPLYRNIHFISWR